MSTQIYFTNQDSQAAITVTAISPNTGSTAGGTDVTITGAGFLPSAPTTMQDPNLASYCTNNMSVYPDTANGPNTLTLADTRNNQDYMVRKLADGNCWMINNLKLAPNTTLTSTDTDLNTISTFSFGGNTSLIDDSSTYSYDTPYVYGPLNSANSSNNEDYDTSDPTSDHFGGYLYNWSAATAGESTTSMPGDGTNNDIAPNSICPKNWRLPKGGDYGAFDPNDEFDQLNAKMAGYPNNQDPAYQAFQPSYYNDPQFYDNWQSTGAFRGVFAGVWLYGFYDQGGNGYFWSSSAYPGGPYGAFNALFDSSVVVPDGDTGRGGGLSLRCLSPASAPTPTTPLVVTFDGVPATNVTIINDTTITATTPAHATPGAVNVVVGTETLTNGFTYADAPTVTISYPSAGPVTAGTSLRILGTGFTGATVVTIGGTACVSFTVVSNTEVSCEAPAHTAGMASIQVTTSGGTNATNTLYTYMDAPTITNISPNSGPTAGGTLVTVTGTNFVASGGSYILGDTNGDGMVTMDDAILLSSVMNSGFSVCDFICRLSSDVDNDGIFSSVDILHIAQYVGGNPGTGNLVGTVINSVGTTVYFGNIVPCQSVTVISTTSLTCVVPPQGSLAAMSNMIVATPGGVSPTPVSYRYIDPYISLTLDTNNLNIGGSSINPTASGTFTYAANQLSVKTNIDGYDLSISTNTTDNNMHHLSLGETVASTTGTWTSKSTLGTNKWGFTQNTSPTDNATIWSAVPNNTSPLTIKSTTIPNETSTGDQTTINYGANIDMFQPPGTYRAVVVYTIIGNVPPNHLSNVVSNNNITIMQGLTNTLCQSADYDDTNNGNNINNTVTLTDTRNNQDYMVRKLADGNCWMINNLKLGSMAGATTLYGDTSNIDPVNKSHAVTALLPQVGVTTDAQHDQPRVYGPLSGQSDDINSDAFYGYLYNWCSATANNPATCTAGGTMPTDATIDICPVNWRLPKSGYYDDVNNEFSQLNAKMAGYTDNQDSTYQSNYYDYSNNFLFDGPFRGVLAGRQIASPSWTNQGTSGYVWSSSHFSSFSATAFGLNFDSWGVIPGYYSGVTRSDGYAVRCLVGS
ncbi:hypothetical protein FACS189431_4690 [Alphaproteobacteria bacterium]|nr:hypothetical protein FACS189431_4690 [Alphaproteobacteria bacterium]